MIYRLFPIFLLLPVLLLGGCRDQDELETYIEQVKSRAPKPLDPIPAFEPPEIYLYVSASLGTRTPFDIFDDIVDVIQDENGIQPDRQRPREELEQFSLDTLRMVGTLELTDVTYGLIKNKAGTIYRVREGNYMGQNYGRITGIFLDRIELVEIVGDRMGGFVERNSSIGLGQQ